MLVTVEGRPPIPFDELSWHVIHFRRHDLLRKTTDVQSLRQPCEQQNVRLCRYIETLTHQPLLSTFLHPWPALPFSTHLCLCTHLCRLCSSSQLSLAFAFSLSLPQLLHSINTPLFCIFMFTFIFIYLFSLSPLCSHQFEFTFTQHNPCISLFFLCYLLTPFL